MRRSFLWFLTGVLATTALVGCKSAYDAAYYNTMEAFGKEKRDLLVDRVDDARDSQEDAKEQFSNALERFSDLVDYDGGELEAVYNRLETDFERSERQAEDVRESIDEVEDVAEALFTEWEEELTLYSDASLRRSSEQQLGETRVRYNELIQAMRRAESKMDPVLDAFRDQVLFLKHNLNARAIASLEDTARGLETDVASLIAEMEVSIQEANAFIDDMQSAS
jgi:hypothetical protein